MHKIINIFVFVQIFGLSFCYLPYHSHGFNQTKMMWQLVQKNTRSFKVDIALASLESCQLHGDRQEYPLSEIKYNDVMGCLALLGDNSSNPYPNSDFETTETFLEFLASEKLWKVIQKWDTPLWFELDFQSHDDIKFEYELLIDFMNKLIDVLDSKNGKIKVGGQQNCFQLQFDEYCRKNPDLKCQDNDFYKKLQLTKNVACMNNITLCPEKSFLNAQFLDAVNKCRDGFDPFLQTENEFQFWEMNNKQTIVFTSDILNNHCQKLQNHRYKFTSNIDIDQFRNSYYMDYQEEDKIYLYSKLEEEKIPNLLQQKKQDAIMDDFMLFYYISSFDYYVFFFQNKNNIVVKVANLVQDQTKIIFSQTFQASEVDVNKSYIKENNIYLYNGQITMVLQFQQNGSFQMEQHFNKYICQQWIAEQNSDKTFCINVIQKQDGYFFLTLSQVNNITMDNLQQYTFNLPNEIINMNDYKIVQDKGDLILTITQEEKNDNQQKITLTYMLLLDLENQQISNYYTFIGQIQSIDILDSNFILITNKSQVQYGHGLINNNDRNICFSQIEYNNQLVYRNNTGNNIQYYYGRTQDLKELEENKLIGYCDDKVLHGNLGYAKKASVKYVKSKRNTSIPLEYKSWMYLQVFLLV